MMNFSKMMKLELWKIICSKTFLIPSIIEVASIILSQIDIEKLFLIENPVISSYVGVSLTFRYIYTSFMVSKLFSQDKEDGIIDTYVAVGFKKTIIWSVKEIYLIITCSIYTLLSAFIYFLLFVIFNKNPENTSVHDFWLTIVWTIVPLIIHIVFLTTINLLTDSLVVTTLTSIAMITSSNLLPYIVSKWIYITYNNPNLVFIYKENDDAYHMIGVFIVELIVFIFINFLIFERKQR